MDWVHCNGCFAQPCPGRSFFLTNCGHIFCQLCREKDPNVCVVCKSPCNAIQLTSQLRPEIERYFTDPVELAKRLIQVLEFQKGHRQKLSDYKAKYISDLEALRASTADLQRENQLLKEENAKLKTLLGRGERSTPRCGGSGGGGGGRITPNGTAVMTTPSPRTGDVRVYSVQSSPLKADVNMPPPRVPPGPARVTVRAPPTNGQMGGIQATPTGILNRILSQTPSSYPPSGHPTHTVLMSRTQGANGLVSPGGSSTVSAYSQSSGSSSQPLLMSRLQGPGGPHQSSNTTPLTSGARRTYELTPRSTDSGLSQNQCQPSISLSHPTSQPYHMQHRPIIHATPMQSSPMMVIQRPGATIIGGRGLHKT